jgi:hypothetical protein
MTAGGRGSRSRRWPARAPAEPVKELALDEAGAAALAAFINENDPQYRAIDLFVPSAGSPDAAFYLVVLTDRAGGNPPALRSLEDYRRHMADRGYTLSFRGGFEAWVWMWADRRLRP